jgi:hypothetical protein
MGIDAGHPVVLEITMPLLEELWAIETDDISIRDFLQPQLRIVNEGSGNIEAFVEVENLVADLTGENKMTLRGKGKYLRAILDNHAELNAEHYQVSVADAELTNQSKASLSATDTLRQRIKDSEIASRLNPVVIQQ